MNLSSRIYAILVRNTIIKGYPGFATRGEKSLSARGQVADPGRAHRDPFRSSAPSFPINQRRRAKLIGQDQCFGTRLLLRNTTMTQQTNGGRGSAWQRALNNEKMVEEKGRRGKRRKDEEKLSFIGGLWQATLFCVNSRRHLNLTVPQIENYTIFSFTH